MAADQSATGYILPNSVRGDTESTLSIDSRTGSLTWNKPRYRGNYVFTIQVQEWRRGGKIGVIYRDILITVTGDEPVSLLPDGQSTGNIPTSTSPAKEWIFKLYPNPATDKVMIHMPKTHSQAVAEIWSTTGQLFNRELLQISATTERMVEVGHLPAGMYIVKILSAGGYFTRKLLITH
jgi:hypothetical protein